MAGEAQRRYEAAVAGGAKAPQVRQGGRRQGGRRHAAGGVSALLQSQARSSNPLLQSGPHPYLPLVLTTCLLPSVTRPLPADCPQV